MGWVQFFLAESQSRLYPHMRAKFGCDPTAGSKKLPLKFIIGFSVAPMPATACCTLSRSLPGPWPGQYNFVQFIMLFSLCVIRILYTVYFMLLVIGLNKIFLNPES